MNRRAGIVPFLLAQGCAHSFPDYTTGCEQGSRTQARPSVLEVSNGQAFVSATWYSEVGCGRGQIGSAIYEVTLANGAVTAATLPNATRMGAITATELIVIAGEDSGHIGVGGPAFAAPIGNLTAVSEVPIRATGVTSSGGRAYFATDTADIELIVRGPDAGSMSAVTIDEPAYDLAAGFGGLWTVTEAGTVHKYDFAMLEEIHAETACASSGEIAAIGDRIFVQCEAGGIVALSGTGGNVVATVATGEQISFLEGRAGDPFGFVSYYDSQTSHATRILSPESGLIGAESAGYFSHAFVVSPTLAVAYAPLTGGVYRVNVPEGSVDLLDIDGSHVAALPDGTILIARGDFNDLVLELVRLDPVTGEELGSPISLPEPDSYYDED